MSFHFLWLKKQPDLIKNVTIFYEVQINVFYMEMYYFSPKTKVSMKAHP